MSDVISAAPESGKAWYKSEKARIGAAVAGGAVATIGAAMLVDAMTDDKLGRYSGKMAGKSVKAERELFRSLRKARLERAKAAKAFKSARRSKSDKDKTSYRQQGRKHWKRYLAAMKDVDEALAKFEARSFVIAKAAGVKNYSGKPPQSHPAVKATKEAKKARKAAKQDAEDMRELVKALLTAGQAAQAPAPAAAPAAAPATPAPAPAAVPQAQAGNRQAQGRKVQRTGS